MPELPPLEGGEYLIGYLWDVGPTMAAGMGPGPVTEFELQAWQHNTGIELAPWESRFIRRLSMEHLDASQKAEKPDCPAPWQPVEVIVDRAAVANSLLDDIRKLAQL